MDLTHIPIITIVGPTGIGKTRLSIVLAKALGGEVISVDSLQVYRDGPIITAKVTAAEMGCVTHHLVDYLNADEEPSNFVEMAVLKIEEIRRRGKIVILCGGSTSLTAPLLFHPTLKHQRSYVIILDSSRDVLYKRLDDRVDQMVTADLVNELCHLYRLEKELVGDLGNVPRGVWKAIGYPELRPCFEVDDPVIVISRFWEGIRKMKENTRRYANTQLSWLRLSLVLELAKRNMDFYILNVRDSATFVADVEAPAISQSLEWIRGSINLAHSQLRENGYGLATVL